MAKASPDKEQKFKRERQKEDKSEVFKIFRQLDQ